MRQQPRASSPPSSPPSASPARLPRASRATNSLRSAPVSELTNSDKESGIGKGSLTYADGNFYMKRPSWAHPVVCDGRLYLRYDNNLYCFDVKGR